MLIGFRPKPLTLAELMAIVNPEQARQPEVVPWVLYSERTYTSAATLNLSFFDTNQADPTIDNVSGGQLPSPQFFQEQQIYHSFLRAPTRSAAVASPAGALNDIALLLKTGRGLAIHTISQKEYLRFPARMAGSSGGELGTINGTYTADIDLQQGNNGQPGHSPYQVNGMIVIPPQTNFTYAMLWAAAQTLSGNMQIAVEIYGALYRKVL